MTWKDKFPKENRYFETENGILYKAEAIDTMSKFPKWVFDAIITDPPYWTTACKWDSIIPFEDMWRELKRIRKDRTPIVLFWNEPFSSLLRISNLKEYRYDVIWQKEKPSNPFTIRKQFWRVHENISIFYKKTPMYNPQMNNRKNITNPKPMKWDLNIDETNVITGVYKHSQNYNPKLIYPISILKFNRDSKKWNKSLHPTQKPLALMEYLIKTYTNEWDLVLDFTCGSWTTLIACEKLNRKWIGIELNEEYCEIAKQRILNFNT